MQIAEIRTGGCAGETGTIPRFCFTTADLAPRDRFQAWRKTIEVLFESAPPKRPSLSPFSATLTAFHFGVFLLCHSQIDAGRYRRSARRLQWDDVDHFVLSLCLRGSVVFGRNGAFPARLRPLDIGILDLSASADILIAQGEAISLILPRTAMPPSVAGPSPRPGWVLLRESPLGAFLGRLMVGLIAAAPRLGMHEATALALGLPAVVASCLGADPRCQPEGSRTARADIGRQLRLHIEKNLHLETLGSTKLMADLHLSRSQLYRQFEKTGGVGHYIRRRRLRRCLLTLCSPLHADQRIADIAYDMGFTDEAHFSRLFRQTFGVSPRAARAAARRGDGAVLAALVPSPPDSSRFADWIVTLMGG